MRWQIWPFYWNSNTANGWGYPVTEVNNVDEIQEESERAYRLLQKSVDAQLHNPGFIASENGKKQRGEGNQTEKTDPQLWNCTEKQRGLILKILSQNELSESAVEQVAQEITRRQMSDLQKGQASLVVGEVLDRWGSTKQLSHLAKDLQLLPKLLPTPRSQSYCSPPPKNCRHARWHWHRLY